MNFIDAETIKDLWSQDTDGSIPILLTIKNPDIFWTEEEKTAYGQADGEINFISDNMKVKYKDKTWIPCGFTFNPPEKNGKTLGSASITISAIDARVKSLLRTIKLTSEVEVIALFCKEKKENGKDFFKFVELNNLTFLVKTATCNKTSATFNLVPNISLNQNVPYDMALSNRVPAASL